MKKTLALYFERDKKPKMEKGILLSKTVGILLIRSFGVFGNSVIYSVRSIVPSILLALTLLIASCGSDDGGPDPATAPTVEFTMTNSVFFASATEKISVTATATGVGLQNFVLQIRNNAVSSASFEKYTDQPASGTEDRFLFTLDANVAGTNSLGVGNYTFKISVTDQFGRVASDEKAITVDKLATSLTITLGTGSNTAGSFFEFANRESGILKLSEVTAANYQAIDLVYHYSADPNIGAILFSLSDPYRNAAFPDVATAWASPKVNKIKPATENDFALNTIADISAEYEADVATAETERAQILTAGSYFFIKQATTGNVFLVKVTSVDAGENGSITFEIKGSI